MLVKKFLVKNFYNLILYYIQTPKNHNPLILSALQRQPFPKL